MSNIDDTLAKLMEMDGAVGTCLVDSKSSMMLASAGGGDAFDLEVASVGSSEVLRVKRNAVRSLELEDEIEDIIVTLGKQFHLIRPLSSNEAIFIYVVFDRARGDLALARHRVAALERDLVI